MTISKKKPLGKYVWYKDDSSLSLPPSPSVIPQHIWITTILEQVRFRIGGILGNRYFAYVHFGYLFNI